MKYYRTLFLALIVFGAPARAASTLYAATKTGPFKSTDSGITRKQLIVTTNDASLPGQPEIFAMAVDPQNPPTVYAFARFGPNGQTLAFLKSTDAGANWSVVSKPTFSYTYGSAALLAIDPVKTNVLYAMNASNGLEITTDGGVTWTAPTIPKPTGSANSGTPNQPSLHGVAADPNHSGVVYVVGGSGSFHPGEGYLLKSADFGNTWTILTTTAGFGDRIFINPKNSQEIYGSSLGNIGCTDPNGMCGIYKSTDGAQSWTELNIPERVVQNVAFDITPGLLYAGAYDGLEDANVYTSADGGNTWKTDFPDSTALVPNFGMQVVRADPNAASTAYVLGTTDANVVSKTTNGGASWTAVSVVVPYQCGSQTCTLGTVIFDLVVVPQAQAAASPPAIASVINGASFLPGISQGSWITVKGANLSGTPRIWAAADFIGNNLPTQLDGVGVTVDGKAAYVYYVSPAQLNVLAPADAAVGPVQVQVTYAGQASNSVSATESTFSPAMFMFDALGRKYVAAVRVDGQYIGPTTLYPGLTAPAHAGDTLQLYATGFGPTNPANTIGQTFVGAPPAANTVTATIGGVPATVQFAGLVGPGEYQFNIVAPAGLPSGDNLIVLRVGGVSTQPGAYLTVQ